MNAPGPGNAEHFSTHVEQLVSVLACFPGMVFATDRQGILTLLHGRSFAAAGVGSPAGLAGQSVFEVFHGHPALVYIMERALGGQPCNATVGLANLVMEFWCGPYCDSSGAIAGMMGTAVDITERLKTGEAYRQTKEMLEALVQASPVGMAILDLEEKVRLWNPASERMNGWSRDEVLGRPLPVIPSQDVDSSRSLSQRIFKGNSITDEEHLSLRKDGTVFPVSISAAPLHNATGEVAGAMFVAMDLTERKRAEEALQEAKFRAEAANRAKSEFLTNMSHEIRTPMNAVLGMLQLVLDTPLNSEQEHYLRVAKSGAESLMGLLSDILDFSRIEARTLALALEDFDLRALVGETAEALALQAHDKGLELTCQVACSIPAVLNGDPLRLRQILTNLLANALKFTPQGEIGIVVGTERETEDAVTLRFQVTDTGIGVAPDRAAEMFDAFVQGDGSTTRKFGGVGLGLTISRQLVKMMGGEIGVESELSKGSTFWFTANFGKAAGEALAKAPAAPLLNGLKVLVVDDNGANRTHVSVLLKLWGARCYQACDGASALAALRRGVRAGEPFHLVLLDMSLPEVSGEEIGREIAADAELRGAKLVLMTYPGQRFDPESIRRAGFDGYIWKPVLDHRLADTIVHALSREKNSPLIAAGFGAVANGSQPERKRILVVEDDPASREVAVALAEKLGYGADPVDNGSEALTALQSTVYDAVLMDCEMPGMDGLETTARVRSWRAGAHNAAIPIIALTAHARAVDRERCLRAGMNDYLTKPIDGHKLATTLSRWLPDSTEDPPAQERAIAAECRSVFNGEELLRRLGGKWDVASRMIDRFVAETPGRIEHLRSRILDCDSAGASSYAQVFGDAAAEVSARSLSALAKALDEAARQSEFGKAAGLLPRMERDFREFTRTVQGR